MTTQEKDITTVFPALTEPITVYVSARSLNDNANAPSKAWFIVSDTFLTKLKELQQIVIENSLVSVCVWGNIEWENGAEYRMQAETMEVSNDSFYFKGSPKHSSYYVETGFIDFEVLAGVLKNALEDGSNVAFFDLEEDEIVEIKDEIAEEGS